MNGHILIYDCKIEGKKPEQMAFKYAYGVHIYAYSKD